MNIQRCRSVTDKCPQRSKHQLIRSTGQEATTPITGSHLSSGRTDWCTAEHGGLLSGALGQTHKDIFIVTDHSSVHTRI